jgi:hypothetical protein
MILIKADASAEFAPATKTKFESESSTFGAIVAFDKRRQMFKIPAFDLWPILLMGGAILLAAAMALL